MTPLLASWYEPTTSTVLLGTIHVGFMLHRAVLGKYVEVTTMIVTVEHWENLVAAMALVAVVFVIHKAPVQEGA